MQAPSLRSFVHGLAPGLAAAFVLAFAAARPALPDVTVTAANGQRFDGTAVAGEAIRIRFPVCRGGRPKISLDLFGAPPNRPVSFQSVTVFGPDGKKYATAVGEGVTQAQADAFKRHVRQRHSRGRDTFLLNGWAAETGGLHELVVTTNATIDTEASGKIVVKRPRVIRFRGNETTTPLSIPLQPFDELTISVKRVRGTAPLVDEFVEPGRTGFTPQQVQDRRGSRTYTLYADSYGDHGVVVGYQDPAAPAGAWRGRVRITPFWLPGVETMVLVNDPGVPLTVLTSQFRFLSVAWGGPAVGVSSSGDGLVLVTAEANGEVRGQRYTLDLDPIAIPISEYSPVMLADATDFAPGEVVSGHRVIGTGGFHYLGVSTQAGTALLLKKVQPDRTTSATARIVENSTTTTRDFFLATDGSSISVGRFLPPDGHTVHLVDAATMTPSPTTVAIGGIFGPHVNGAGASWRAADGLFEFWAPSSLDAQTDSDLHFLRFDGTWNQISADVTPVDDAGVTEYLSTAVSVDDESGATVVHYVVPENPYEEGRLHRRIFDETGLEVPGSHTILPGSRRTRPTSMIVGDFLFLASEGPSGPTVERYLLLR